MALLCICQSYEAVLPLSRDRMDNRVGLKACKRYRFKWVKPELLLCALHCVAAQSWRKPHARLVGTQKQKGEGRAGSCCVCPVTLQESTRSDWRQYKWQREGGREGVCQVPLSAAK